MKLKSGTFGALKANPLGLVLAVLLVVSAALAVFVQFKIWQQSQNDQAYLGLTADLRAQAYQVGTLSREATAGKEESFEELQSLIGSMQLAWDTLKNGGANGLSAGLSNEAVDPRVLNLFDENWKSLKADAESILNNRDTIVFLNDVAATLNKSLPEVQQEHNNIVEILLENRAPADQVAVAQMQSWRVERIGRNVDKMLRGGDDADEAADQFNRDANLFGKVLKGMTNGDITLGISRVTDSDALQSLTEIRELTDFVNSSVSDIFKSSPALFKASHASASIEEVTPQLLTQLGVLGEAVDKLPSQRLFRNELTLLFVALAGACFILIGYQQLMDTRRRANEQSETNERNQMAILRLLDELADLADGDLTTTATVTEDFTGAIADSINFTIDQLRVLVSRINETAELVAQAAQETQATALHLAEASEHQAQEIAGASAAVNEMAVTIDQVSTNAAESAAVAQKAVAIAGTGSKVVNNTIAGMDTIREQIQDTSKRIKRLGESSQEIGDIVSLINDIADQTNILALNAAIQASMAGEAGRGFAVVADEVQRLAERSAAATKQIENLVKTIQNDTNEAVSSMETTTAEVVRGARLAQDAGVALERIDGVSTNLAELIQNISNAARQQASSAGHISNTMNVIQEITSQTSAGTSATARSIGDLANMAQDLKESVQGFKLPDELLEGHQEVAAASYELPEAPADADDYLNEELPEQYEYNVELGEESDGSDDIYDFDDIDVTIDLSEEDRVRNESAV